MNEFERKVVFSECSLQELLDEVFSEGYEVLAAKESLPKRFLKDPLINRPGLALAGFTDHFDHERIQLIGKNEVTYLFSLSPEKKKRKY